MPTPLYRNVHLADGGILNVAALDLQPQQVLSTALPANPQVGMLVYATDTFQLLQYQSATTGWTAPWNTPWGIMNYAQVTAVQSGITTTVDLTGLTLTTSFVANRRIRISGFVVLGFGASAVATVSITDATPTTVCSSEWTCTASTHSSAAVSAIIVPGALTNKVYKLRLSYSAGTGTIQASSTSPAYILIEDIGPSASPA